MPPPINLGVILGNTFCSLFPGLVVMNSPGLFPFISQILDKQPHHFHPIFFLTDHSPSLQPWFHSNIKPTLFTSTRKQTLNNFLSSSKRCSRTQAGSCQDPSWSNSNTLHYSPNSLHPPTCPSRGGQTF